ncbi:hypothetical protein DB88DRAFT_508912 [Papiliotrema laurentii]|uniref:Uncharacterized protein n=1 Tax=Papiliotrema laurentii TaxID=5418 RepID=A0AAD9FV92_PAPLA|nr:hypothetical protein DB88DRAFT_508912 [Papiliotrema laurentii]
MAYALCRSAAARYALTITLEGGFVAANRHERAIHTPCSSSGPQPPSSSSSDSLGSTSRSQKIDISPSHSSTVRYLPPRSRTPIRRIGRKEEGIGAEGSSNVGEPNRPINHPYMHQPPLYPKPSSTSPRRIPSLTTPSSPTSNSPFAKHRLAQIKDHLSTLTPHRVSAMSLSQLTLEARMTKLLLLDLDAQRGTSPSVHAHRLRLLDAWSVFFRLVERLHEVGEVPEGLIDQSTFDKAIWCVSRSYKLRRRTRGPPSAVASLESPAALQASSSTARREGPAGFVKTGTRNISTAITSEDYEDSWTHMTIPSILHLMSSFALTPSASALESMLHAHRTSLIPTGPHAMSIRSRLGFNHRDMAHRALDVWETRSGLLTSMRSFLPKFKNTTSYGQEVVRTLDEADVLSLESHEPWIEQRLTELMGEWKAVRDEMVEEKREILAPMHKRWCKMINTMQQPDAKHRIPAESIGNGIVRAETDREEDAVVFLLRNALLPPMLQPPRWKAKSPRGHPRLDDPFDLLGFLLGYGTFSTVAELPSSRMRQVAACIIRMRNSFYLNHLPSDSNRLASVLIPPTAGTLIRIGTTSLIMHHPPRLDGTVHASLLTSATRPSSMRHLLITLAQLSPPASQPRISRSTMKLLRSQVDQSAEHFLLSGHPEFANMPGDAKHAAEAGGWQGLLDWLLVQWGLEIRSVGGEVDGLERKRHTAEMTRVKDLTLTRPMPRSALHHRHDPFFPYLAART